MNLVGSEDAIKILGIKKPTLYLWVRQGKLVPRRVGKLLKFDEEEVRRLIRPGTVRDITQALERLREGILVGRLEPWTREELHRRGNG